MIDLPYAYFRGYGVRADQKYNFFGRRNQSCKPVLPRLFWYMSISGSLLLLSYFIFGKNDSVGILSNFFPAFVSIYNLVVHMREVRRRDLVESEV